MRLVRTDESLLCWGGRDEVWGYDELGRWVGLGYGIGIWSRSGLGGWRVSGVGIV